MQTKTIAGISVISLLMAACTTLPDDGTGPQPIGDRIDEVLDIPTEGTEAPALKRCLRETQIRNFEPLGDRHMLFEGRRGEYWVNRLSGRCPDLDGGTLLAVRTSGLSNQFCDGDRFSLRDWFTGGRGTNLSAVCSLGKFQSVSEVQVQDILFEIDQD
ncbi:MAG: DUF6491 family protein [Pseudomonadota bacterium]